MSGPCYSWAGHMAFINKDELNKRLSEDRNLRKRLRIADENRPPERAIDEATFKRDGTLTRLPKYDENARALIGATAIAVGVSKAAEIFDVSVGLARDLGKGVETRKPLDDPEAEDARKANLQKRIYEELSIIRSAAKEKLLLALDKIDETSLQLIPDKDKALKSAQIAGHLSSIIDRTIQKDHAGGSASAHLHLYAPEQRPIAAFDIKRVGDAESEV